MVSYTITDILNDWAELGVFAYVLPFLMVFAIVYGILNKTGVLGKNKGVQATIGLVVGLMSLQFDIVSNFFASIFPYTGVGLAVLLVALILMGLISEENWARYIWLVLGGIIFFIVVFTALTDFSWFGGRAYIWNDVWPMVIIGMVALGLIALVVFGGGDKGGGGGEKK